VILINLLPPELRKRRGGVSPVFLSIVVGGAANAAAIGFWVWIAYFRIPAAQQLQAKLTQDELDKGKQAAVVTAMEQEIVNNQARRDTIVGLTARKVYWARTMDDFAQTMDGPWINQSGFEVCISDLSFREGVGTSGRANEAQEIVFDFRIRYKIVGASLVESGQYVKSFYSTIEKSPFWINYGFQGKPEEGYTGDTPRWNSTIGRVMVELPADWRRVQVLTKKPRAGG